MLADLMIFYAIIFLCHGFKKRLIIIGFRSGYGLRLVCDRRTRAGKGRWPGAATPSNVTWPSPLILAV
jgi:hypothetical protein